MKATILGLFFIVLTLCIVPVVFSQNEEVLSEDFRGIIVEGAVSGSEGKSLIPKTGILKPNDTKFYTYKYYVEVSSEMELEVIVDDVLVNGSDDFSEDLKSVFNFDVQFRIIEPTLMESLSTRQDVHTYEVFVIITMEEPSSYEQYLLVTENDLTVDYIFAAI